MTNYKLAIKT